MAANKPQLISHFFFFFEVCIGVGNQKESKKCRLIVKKKANEKKKKKNRKIDWADLWAWFGIVAFYFRPSMWRGQIYSFRIVRFYIFIFFLYFSLMLQISLYKATLFVSNTTNPSLFLLFLSPLNSLPSARLLRNTTITITYNCYNFLIY